MIDNDCMQEGLLLLLSMLKDLKDLFALCRMLREKGKNMVCEGNKLMYILHRKKLSLTNHTDDVILRTTRIYPNIRSLRALVNIVRSRSVPPIGDVMCDNTLIIDPRCHHRKTPHAQASASSSHQIVDSSICAGRSQHLLEPPKRSRRHRWPLLLHCPAAISSCLIQTHKPRPSWFIDLRGGSPCSSRLRASSNFTCAFMAAYILFSSSFMADDRAPGPDQPPPMISVRWERKWVISGDWEDRVGAGVEEGWSDDTVGGGDRRIGYYCTTRGAVRGG